MKRKNALRKHYVAPYIPSAGKAKEPAEDDWLWVAKDISAIADDTDEETDDTGFYDGTGSPEPTVTAVTIAYSPEGFYNPEDPAQKLIADLKLEEGEGRLLWFKVVSSDGKSQISGLATATDIIAGDGDAVEYETFSCTITFNTKPNKKDVPPVTPPVVPTAIKLSAKTSSVAVGAADNKITASVEPAGANQGITVTSAAVATATASYAGGKITITGVKEGTTTVTVKSVEKPTVTDTIAVTVTATK